MKEFKKIAHLSGMDLSKVWVTIDEHEDTIRAPEFWNFFTLPGVDNAWYSLPASRHRSAATLSFADGHIEIKKWKDPRTLKPVTGTSLGAFLCPNNPDKTWLDERTTEIYKGTTTVYF